MKYTYRNKEDYFFNEHLQHELKRAIQTHISYKMIELVSKLLAVFHGTNINMDHIFTNMSYVIYITSKHIFTEKVIFLTNFFFLNATAIVS